MNRFIKYVLIAAAVCFAAGILMSGCAGVMGGTFFRGYDESRVLSGKQLGGFIGNIVRNSLRGELSGAREDISGDETNMLVNVYPAADIRDLEIKAVPSRILIQEGETDTYIRVERTSEKIVLKDKLSDSRLELSFENARGILNLPEGEMVRITIPAGQQFRKVEMEADASSIEADRIRAEEMDISAEAASIVIGSPSADDLKLEADAGSIEIGEGAAETLKIENAAGSVDYTGAAERSVEAETEVGRVVLMLDGSAEDFNFRTETEIGEIKVEGLADSEGGLRGKQTIRHDGAEKTAKLECSMGVIEMNFR